MAQHVEPMDIDSSVCEFDNKENSFHNSNVLPRTPCTEKGYEELDVSELNMKLRYSMTPANSPMSKSFTANCLDNRHYESGDNPAINNGNLTRSMNATMILNETMVKTQSGTPLQSLQMDNFMDGNRNALRTLESTVNITVTGSGSPSEIDETLSFPSTSSSMAHTPEATTPTTENPKCDGGSPIMRGLKSVLNMFRPSQSPIPPGEDEDVKPEILSPPIVISPEITGKSKTEDILVSTPLNSHKAREVLTKRNSPNRDSIVFNEDLEKELRWNEETTILFSKEKIPIHKLFPQQAKPESRVPMNLNLIEKSPEKPTQENLDSTVEYMDVSFNDSAIRDKTMTEGQSIHITTDSDNEFLDCETTFSKNDSQVSFQSQENNEEQIIVPYLNTTKENLDLTVSVKSADVSAASTDTAKATLNDSLSQSVLINQIENLLEIDPLPIEEKQCSMNEKHQVLHEVIIDPDQNAAKIDFDATVVVEPVDLSTIITETTKTVCDISIADNFISEPQAVIAENHKESYPIDEKQVNFADCDPILSVTGDNIPHQTTLSDPVNTIFNVTQAVDTISADNNVSFDTDKVEINNFVSNNVDVSSHNKNSIVTDNSDTAPTINILGVNSMSQIPLIVDPRVLLFNIQIETHDGFENVKDHVLDTVPADIPLPDDEDTEKTVSLNDKNPLSRSDDEKVNDLAERKMNDAELKEQVMSPPDVSVSGLLAEKHFDDCSEEKVALPSFDLVTDDINNQAINYKLDIPSEDVPSQESMKVKVKPVQSIGFEFSHAESVLFSSELVTEELTKSPESVLADTTQVINEVLITNAGEDQQQKVVEDDITLDTGNLPDIDKIKNVPHSDDANGNSSILECEVITCPKEDIPQILKVHSEIVLLGDQITEHEEQVIASKLESNSESPVIISVGMPASLLPEQQTTILQGEDSAFVVNQMDTEVTAELIGPENVTDNTDNIKHFISQELQQDIPSDEVDNVKVIEERVNEAEERILPASEIALNTDVVKQSCEVTTSTVLQESQVHTDICNTTMDVVNKSQENITTVHEENEVSNFNTELDLLQTETSHKCDITQKRVHLSQLDVVIAVNEENSVMLQVTSENSDCIINEFGTLHEQPMDITMEEPKGIELKKDEEIVTSENNSPFVSVTADIDLITESEPLDNLEKNEHSPQVKTSPPSSPKIVSKGYNFNFDEIEDPFATKTKIRMSPPLGDTPNQSFDQLKLERPDIPKREINKNRLKSQPERKKPTSGNKKINSSFTGALNVDGKTPFEKVDDKTIKEVVTKTVVSEAQNIISQNLDTIKPISRETCTSEASLEHIEQNVSMTDVEIPVSTLQKHSNEAFTASDMQVITAVESTLAENTIDNKSSGEKIGPVLSEDNNTSSSEQSTYYSAGASTHEGIESKNVFNIPEIGDKNFNPFITKSKMRQSPPPSINIDNKPLSSHENSTIAENTLTVDSTKDIASPKQLTSIASDDKLEMPLEEKDSSNNISTTTCSLKTTDDRDNTVREIHTEDEDTIEGPFLQAEDLNDDKMSDFDGENVDMMQFSELSPQENDDNDAAELFIDAEAFEFLLNQNNSNVVSDSGKESLFLKFDPLFAKRVSSDGMLAALKKVQKRQSTPKKMRPPPKDVKCENKSPVPGPSTLNVTREIDINDENNEDFNVTVSKPMMVVNPAVNSVVTPRKSLTPTRTNRRSLTFTSPAIAVIDRLLSMSANNSMAAHETTIAEVRRESNEADLALTQLRELLADKEINVYNLRSESKELKERLANLESQMKTLESISEERLKKINELSERLTEKTKMNKSMATVVEEYERTIASLISETEQDRKRHAEERLQLMKERDEQTAHLASMEVSFSDLHSKYEKSKQVILGFKANEDLYKKSIKEFEDNLSKMQNNYELLKQHATSKLNHANDELQKMNRSHEAEVLKLNAMIKRKELHITSLEETLTQKTKANEELTAICDELINKVG